MHRTWKPGMKVSVSRRHILYILLAAAGLFLAWLFRLPLFEFAAWVGDRQGVTETMSRLGLWGPATLFGLLVLQVFLAVIPGHALILAGGYVFGFTLSLAITLSSTVLGSEIAFAIARRYGRQLIYRLASQQVIERWDRRAAGQGTFFFFLSFILPAFPSDLMCYVAGLGTISPWRFFLANLAGRFLTAFFLTLVGAYGTQMPIYIWAAAAFLLAALYAGWLLYNRRAASKSV